MPKLSAEDRHLIVVHLHGLLVAAAALYGQNPELSNTIKASVRALARTTEVTDELPDPGKLEPGTRAYDTGNGHGTRTVS